MKNLITHPIIVATLGSLLLSLQPAFSQGTAFMYQGQLLDGGLPATGSYDLRLTLFDAVTNGNTIAGPVTNTAVAVSNGLFTTLIDFGDAFDGNLYWLRLQVRTNGANNFTSLSPRQQLTPAPYAEFATTASNLSGTVSFSQMPAGIVTNNEMALNLTGNFSGNGAAMSNVNAATLNGLTVGSLWQLGGNNVAGGQFIGSTNSQPVEIWAASQRAFRVEPDTTGSGSPNVIGGSVGNFMNAGGVIGGFIGGGGATNYNGASYPNHVAAYYGSVVGGYANTIVSFANSAFIGGGDNNSVAGNSAVISGGEYNRIKSAADHGVIAGGIYNTNGGEFGVIGGGQNDTVTAKNATVSGGYENSAYGEFGTIAGGNDNLVVATSATVGGGYNNGAYGQNSVVAGGAGNATTAGGEFGTIAGGNGNSVSGTSATVGGGYNNTAYGQNSVVAGGGGNYTGGLGGFASTVGGGWVNQANADYSTVAGGEDNNANGTNSSVGGGQNNLVIGVGATVPGGVDNEASGMDSFAAGNGALAFYNGSFVWSDQTGTGTSDSAPNQFVARASGGFTFLTGTGYYGVSLTPGATSWTVISDRKAKKNFKPVDTEAVLNKLAAVPIEQWNYKWEKDGDVPNIGPMAQDFIAAFYPGRDDKGITTLQFDGVELAAIQGLNEKVEREASLRQKLEAENADLKARLEKLEQLMDTKNGGAK
jgi:hypothetical protein